MGKEEDREMMNKVRLGMDKEGIRDKGRERRAR